MTTICLIPGDGIGVEVVAATRRVLSYLAPAFAFTEASAGWATFQERGMALPPETLAAVRAADATLFGAVSSPLQPVPGYQSPIVAMRKALDLYANLRPVVSYPITASRPGIDLLIVRENTEGLYSGRERAGQDEAVTERVITRRASERIVHAAFRLARQRRRQVTIVHKANVLRATCGLFREVAFGVATQYPDVRAEEMIVDTAAMRLITTPEHFDVIVTTNLFGDVLSDEASALVGGLGLAPSGNVGDRWAVFEPVHGSAPDIAGRGIANPLAALGAGAMLLHHVGENSLASRLHAAIRQVLAEGVLTPDLGGTATTEQVISAVLSALDRS